MNCIPKNPAQRRYLTRFIPATIAYIALLILSVTLLRGHTHSTPVVYLLAALPALPIVAMLVIVGMYLVEETDEFERLVVVQSMLWAMGGMLALTTVWGFLELFARVPQFPGYLNFAVFWGFVGMVTPVVRRRYR